IVFVSVIFCFNVTSITYISTLSLHDALPISRQCMPADYRFVKNEGSYLPVAQLAVASQFASDTEFNVFYQAIGTLERKRLFLRRSEEHTSELQSRENLVCRLLLEKKKRYNQT